MMAIKGISENGVVKLLENVPSIKTEVMVIFPNADDLKSDDGKTEEALQVLDKYRGRLKGVTDEKEMRMEATIEKYESID